MEDTFALVVARLLIGAVAAYMLFKNYREIRDAIENFTNRFPPGGSPPTHPLPTQDGRRSATRQPR